MNDLKMNNAGSLRINSDTTPKCYMRITPTGEINITGTEEDVRKALETTPDHMKHVGHLMLEILRLRKELSLHNVIGQSSPDGGSELDQRASTESTAPPCSASSFRSVSDGATSWESFSLNEDGSVTFWHEGKITKI